jgi:sulfate permease, SulP family
MPFPIGGWLFSYRRAWLRSDLVAGLTAAAVVIPQAMAYAALAGLPVQTGLYCALAAMLVYPLLGSSRPLSVTTTSAIAMLTASQVAAAASAHPGIPATSMAATLALLVGAILVAARVLRLGFLANFISKPVLVGFQAGVGVAILVGQLKSVLGVAVTSSSTIGVLAQLPGLLPHTQLPTLLIAAIGIALLVAAPRLAPRLPTPLIWVGASIAASALFGLAAMGIATIGAVPAGLPALRAPDLALAAFLWPGALGIALMAFTEGVAAARTFRNDDDAPVDTGAELIAVGAANIAAALVGGMPAGGGASQTAVADRAGAKSQMAQWVGAGAVVVTLTALSQAIGLMPKAALAAVIVATGISMIKPATFGAIARVRRDELGWALATVAGVIAFGTLNGILVAVVLSLLTLIYQANHPPVYAMAYDREDDVFRRAGAGDDDQILPGLLVVGTQGRLHFANAERARDRIRALAERSSPRVLVIDCSAIPDIEYTALLMLTEAERKARSEGAEIWLASVNPDLRRIIDRSPLGAALGSERIFFTLRKAVEAWRRRGEAAAPATMLAGGSPADADPGGR